MNPQEGELRMEIGNLSDNPALVRQISEWHQREWGHLSERTVEDRIAEFAEHGTGIPLTLVAWLNGEPVGTASLLLQDMDAHPELTPWLGSVYVLSAYRGRGIGGNLIKGAMAEAARLGVETLYLFTEDRAGFYEKLGWEAINSFLYHGQQVTLMQIAPRLGKG
ncbi:MAG: GNAT family N-acetyltransferase [SAR324 cluster bacterium]|nr:GNAT family N-acetyltransferase [SAR324 cluster bacterium]